MAMQACGSSEEDSEKATTAPSRDEAAAMAAVLVEKYAVTFLEIEGRASEGGSIFFDGRCDRSGSFSVTAGLIPEYEQILGNLSVEFSECASQTPRGEIVVRGGMVGHGAISRLSGTDGSLTGSLNGQLNFSLAGQEYACSADLEVEADLDQGTRRIAGELCGVTLAD